MKCLFIYDVNKRQWNEYNSCINNSSRWTYGILGLIAPCCQLLALADYACLNWWSRVDILVTLTSLKSHCQFLLQSIAPTLLKESHQMPRCARHPLLLLLLQRLSSWAASFFTPLFIATGPCFEAASSSSGPHHKRNEKSLGIPHPARRHICTNPTYTHILHRIYVYGIQIHLFSFFFGAIFCGITFCVHWCDGWWMRSF